MSLSKAIDTREIVREYRFVAIKDGKNNVRFCPRVLVVGKPGHGKTSWWTTMETALAGGNDVRFSGLVMGGGANVTIDITSHVVARKLTDDEAEIARALDDGRTVYVLDMMGVAEFSSDESVLIRAGHLPAMSLASRNELRTLLLKYLDVPFAMTQHALVVVVAAASRSDAALAAKYGPLIAEVHKDHIPVHIILTQCDVLLPDLLRCPQRLLDPNDTDLTRLKDEAINTFGPHITGVHTWVSYGGAATYGGAPAPNNYVDQNAMNTLLAIYRSIDNYFTRINQAKVHPPSLEKNGVRAPQCLACEQYADPHIGSFCSVSHKRMME